MQHTLTVFFTAIFQFSGNRMTLQNTLVSEKKTHGINEWEHVNCFLDITGNEGRFMRKIDNIQFPMKVVSRHKKKSFFYVFLIRNIFTPYARLISELSSSGYAIINNNI